jgi:hypothetical protein
MSFLQINATRSGSESYSTPPAREQIATDQPTWEPLKEEKCQEDVALLKEHFPEARFSLLKTREENDREHPILKKCWKVFRIVIKYSSQSRPLH